MNERILKGVQVSTGQCHHCHGPLFIVLDSGPLGSNLSSKDSKQTLSPPRRIWFRSGLSVCVSVCKISQKLWTYFDDTFKEECLYSSDKSISFSRRQIWILSRILDHFPGFFTIGRYGVTWHFSMMAVLISAEVYAPLRVSSHFA